MTFSYFPDNHSLSARCWLSSHGEHPRLHDSMVTGRWKQDRVEEQWTNPGGGLHRSRRVWHHCAGSSPHGALWPSSHHCITDGWQRWRTLLELLVFVQVQPWLHWNCAFGSSEAFSYSVCEWNMSESWVSVQNISQQRGGWAAVWLQVSICPGMSRALPPVATLWTGVQRETKSPVIWNGLRCQKETCWSYLLVGFILLPSIVYRLKDDFLFGNWLSFSIILQNISKQVTGTHSASMDAQNMDTDYWKYRLDTCKSSVSFFIG